MKGFSEVPTPRFEESDNISGEGDTSASHGKEKIVQETPQDIKDISKEIAQKKAKFEKYSHGNRERE